ncbi:MAG: HD domain-containing protein [Methanothrix sp.]
MMIDKNSRYIIDPLYGRIYLPDFAWDILTSPELQRLREIRLCNINSLCLTGGANINRFEHAIGTCYLAQKCLNSWPPLSPMSIEEQRHFILAALLHDITSAAFGHSVEYIESKEGFDHENSFNYVTGIEQSDSYKYKSATLEPIFFGLRGMLSSKIPERDLKNIGEMIVGKGKFGPLIRSKMDLDNIDNVFRLAYHIGLVKCGEVPQQLAQSLYTLKGKLIIRDESIHLIEQWHNLRKRLYYILLLNRDEFSAKAMLTEAIEIAKLSDNRSINWRHVDYQFLEKLSGISGARVAVKKQISVLNINNKKMLDISKLAEELKETLGLKSTPTFKEEANGWIMKDGRDEYFIKIKEEKMFVYKQIYIVSELHNTISRLMTGDLYGCISILSTKKIGNYNTFGDIETRIEIETELSHRIRKKLSDNSKFKSSMIAIHPIIDVDKTERQISISTEGGRFITIGDSSNRLLLGVFFRNSNLNINELNKLDEITLRKLRQEIFIYLSDVLDDGNLIEVEPCAELEY